jgi:hypothetical protein
MVFYLYIWIFCQIQSIGDKLSPVEIAHGWIKLARLPFYFAKRFAYLKKKLYLCTLKPRITIGDAIGLLS